MTFKLFALRSLAQGERRTRPPHHINRAASFMAATQSLNWDPCTGTARPLAGHLSVVQREPTPAVTKRRGWPIGPHVNFWRTVSVATLPLRFPFGPATHRLSCGVRRTCEQIIVAMQGASLKYHQIIIFVVVLVVWFDRRKKRQQKLTKFCASQLKEALQQKWDHG